MSIASISATDISLLDTIRIKIEKMDKERHIQALHILAKYPSIILNEPKFGNVNINLSCIPKQAIDDLCKFISLIEEQETQLNSLELQKEEIKTIYGMRDDSSPQATTESNLVAAFE